IETVDQIFLQFSIGMIIIILVSSCGGDSTSPTGLPAETIDQTQQSQQDIETGQRKVLVFKEIEQEEEGGGKQFCSICLEEYEDDHEIMRLNKCGHIFHHFCMDSWLARHRSCPNCLRSVDLNS
ncbi:E3 ubiquitin-protein ligase ATL31, partial [Brassica rapa]